jgi:large-conductance mechanosensitive channel
VSALNQRVVDVILEAAEEDYLAGVKDADTFAAELALFGSTLVTAGDFLSTISAAIALRQIYINKIQNQKDQQEQETQMKDIQDQLTALKKEIKALRGK